MLQVDHLQGNTRFSKILGIWRCDPMGPIIMLMFCQLWIMLVKYGNSANSHNPKCCKTGLTYSFNSISFHPACSYKIRIGLGGVQKGQMDKNTWYSEIQYILAYLGLNIRPSSGGQYDPTNANNYLSKNNRSSRQLEVWRNPKFQIFYFVNHLYWDIFSRMIRNIYASTMRRYMRNHSVVSRAQDLVLCNIHLIFMILQVSCKIRTVIPFAGDTIV